MKSKNNCVNRNLRKWKEIDDKLNIQIWNLLWAKSENSKFASIYLNSQNYCVNFKKNRKISIFFWNFNPKLPEYQLY